MRTRGFSQGETYFSRYNPLRGLKAFMGHLEGGRAVAVLWQWAKWPRQQGDTQEGQSSSNAGGALGSRLHAHI